MQYEFLCAMPMGIGIAASNNNAAVVLAKSSSRRTRREKWALRRAAPLGSSRIEVDNDLMDQRARDPLLQPRIGIRMLPQRLQTFGQRREVSQFRCRC